MSKPTGKLVEGVFAVNKPPSISSAQVIRDLQHHFNPSSLFAQWIAAERAFRQEEQRYQRGRRRDKRIQVKMGHGGTLDPMASGVLILGVGKGTKELQGFLECTKTYETTVLFGAATDTYDVLGKVLKRASYAHVTREKVKDALHQFRGKIMQRPPIYSALRVQGKRLYEYAREGKEVPKEIEKRPVEIKELEIVEWMEGGTHKHRWPEEEAEEEAKDLAEKVLHLDEVSATSAIDDANTDGISTKSPGSKRKRTPSEAVEESVSNKRPNLDQDEQPSEALMSGGLQDPEPTPPGSTESPAPDSAIMQAAPEQKGPPAVRIRMTVTSGFYVRSFSHDLGEAVGSLACMSELVRTRQENFRLGKNVVEYEDFDHGEERWAPRLEHALQEWADRSEGADGREETTTSGKDS
ncbi:pseudouridine synthase pus4 [Lecanora helva]